VAEGFAKAPRRKPQRRRSLLPALGVSGCVLAAIVALVVAGGGGGGTNGDSSGSAASRALKQSTSDQTESSPSAGSGAASSSAAPVTPQIAPSRRVERATRLELTTTDVQTAADGVVRATQASGGFVQSSQVERGDDHGSA